MSGDSRTSSPMLRFLDSFLQEKNIKWLLGVGTLIVLGSSLRLVAAHWNDYPPVWKYLVVVSYTGVIYAAGQLSYWRLALRKTGTGLMALTVLLLPITFLALHWVRPTGSVSLQYLAAHAGLSTLLVANFALSCLAARKIFGHFLRGSQPTFLFSYLTLSVAGAVLPALPGSWCPWVGLTLWAVLTAGVVKVNRHVFWLVEEHRLPQICGFFPIGLLAGQFLALAAMNLVRFVPEYLPLEWIGLAAVLAAVPVLLTADAVARVHQQRTGGLLRPMPWSVCLPLGIGLLLTVAGACLTLTGLPRPDALSPTAVLAAGLFAVVARRIGSRSLVWAMLAAAIAAYNFSPVFFQQFARAAIQHGASAVREPRLPYPFYGLTYLPLLAVLSIAAHVAAKRKSELFSGPLRQCATALAALLLVAAVGHPKAMFPVGLAMTGMFAFQTALFGDRRLMLSAIAAGMLAGWGWTAFARDVLEFEVSGDLPVLSMATVGALLLLPGYWFDRLSRRLPRLAEGTLWNSLFGSEGDLCQSFSLLVAAATTAALLVWACCGCPTADGHLTGFPYASSMLLCGLLMIHTLIWLAPGLGEFALISSGVLGVLWADAQHWTFDELTASATIVGVGFWLLSYLLELRPGLRISRAFAGPLVRLSLFGMTALAVLNYGPRLLLASIFGAGRLDADPAAWLLTLAALVWCFDAARRTCRYRYAAFGCLGVLGLASTIVSAAWGPERGAPWYPAVWSSIALLAAAWSVRARRRPTLLVGPSDSPLILRGVSGMQALVEPVYAIALGVLCSTAMGSLVCLTPAARVAGAIALAGLLLAGILDRRQGIWQECLLLANWHVMVLVAQLCAAEPVWIWNLTPSDLLACSMPVALCAALSRLVFELSWPAEPAHDAGMMDFHRGALKLFAGVALIGSLYRLPVELGPAEIFLAALSFAALTVGELWSACRQQLEELVWLAEAIVVAAIGYFAAFGVVQFGHGWSMFALLGAGFAAWGAGRLAVTHPQLAIMSGPLTSTGMCLPLGAVALGVVRHIWCPPPMWHGMNSMALLLAAGFYFWQGLERGKKSLLVASAAIVNIALALLWRELAWSDPQLFMIPAGASILMLVELLKPEIPETYHNPLRYCGALVILVSPTFQIVGGSWLHLFTLMVASVAVILVSIGLRVRALIYTGTAFLVADLVAMVVRGSVDRPNLLWLAGILLGAAVIVVAAVCENHRELLLQRLRTLAVNIGAWE